MGFSTSLALGTACVLDALFDTQKLQVVRTDCVQVDAREDGEEIARKSVELLLQD